MGNKKWQLNVTPTDKKKLSEKNFEEKTHEELSMEAKDKYAKLSASEKAIKQTTFEGYSEEDVSKLSELFSDKNRFLAISIKTTGFSKGNKPMLVDITGYTFDEEKGEYTLNDSNKYYIYDKGYEFERSARFDSFKSNGIDESDYFHKNKTIDKTSEILNKLFEVAGEKNIPVLVDDASGARLRTVVFNQAKACDLGADIAITSTDKLMPGPRGGLMAGRKDLIDEIKVKVNQFGLEAQPPVVLAMLNGIKNFKEDNLIKSFTRKDHLFELLSDNFNNFKKSPTGVMISPEDLANEVNISHNLSDNDLAFVFSFILLKNHGIITIPAVSMPGASATIRFDLSTSDAFNLDLNDLNKKIVSSFEELLDVIPNEEKCREIVFSF